MASRVVEVFYKLKDLFSPAVKKITGSYRDVERASAQATGKIERDAKRTQSAFSRMRAGADKLRTAWRALAAAAALGGAFEGLRRFANEADRVAKVSSKLGVAVDELTALSYAADRSGLSAGQFEIAMQRLVRKTGDAVNGLGEAQKAFANLGIDANAFAQLGLEQKIAQLSTAFNAIGNQDQALSALQKLVDSEGLGLAVLLREGPSGIKRLTDEARALGNVITPEFAAEAEKFADSMTKAEAAIKGLSVRAGGPLTGIFNQLTGVLGLSANELDNLNAQLDDAYFRLSIAQKFGLESAAETARAQIEQLTGALSELSKARDEASAADAAAAKEQAALIAANAAYTKSLEGTTQAFEARADAKRRALNKETADLEAARKAQLTIEQEFQALVDDISKPDLKPEDISLGDVFLKQRQAAAAAERGEGDAAIKLAREGGDLLGLLKEKGSETSGTLKFLAEQLQRVATTAAGQKVDKEGGELEAAQAAFASVRQQADILKATAPAAGSEYARAFLAAMTAELANTTLPAPKVAAPQVPVARAVTAGASGNDFRFETELERRGVK